MSETNNESLQEALKDLAWLAANGALGGVAEIIRERRRQIEVIGCTPEHDDHHADGELLVWSASRMLNAVWNPILHSKGPGYVEAQAREACALAAAEMDRLNRMLAPDAITASGTEHLIALPREEPGSPRAMTRSEAAPELAAAMAETRQLRAERDSLRSLQDLTMEQAADYLRDAGGLRTQLAAVRERLEDLAAELGASAAATAPSKKSDIERKCAEAVREIAEGAAVENSGGAVSRSDNADPKAAPKAGRCPECDARSPAEHPAVSGGGEVTHLCGHPFHGTEAELAPLSQRTGLRVYAASEIAEAPKGEGSNRAD